MKLGQLAIYVVDKMSFKKRTCQTQASSARVGQCSNSALIPLIKLEFTFTLKKSCKV
jgi:hypothetical protein